MLDRGAGGTNALAGQSAVSENATIMVALAHFISCSITNHQGLKRAMDYRVGERLQGNTQFWLENGQHHIYAYSHPLSMTPIKPTIHVEIYMLQQYSTDIWSISISLTIRLGDFVVNRQRC